jgi:hypothetical protein
MHDGSSFTQRENVSPRGTEKSTDFFVVDTPAPPAKQLRKSLDDGNLKLQLMCIAAAHENGAQGRCNVDVQAAKGC